MLPIHLNEEHLNVVLMILKSCFKSSMAFMIWRPWGRKSGVLIIRLDSPLGKTRHDECWYVAVYKNCMIQMQ